ncbi:MAG TPA: hypothetical protein VGD43_04775, partial [Micromonospora sp.]
MPKLRDRLSAARAGWVSGRSVRVPGTAPYWRTSGTRPQRRLAHPTTPQSERPSKGQTIFQGVTALTAVAAVLFTAQSLGYTADATKATRDQVSLAEQGQITERFSRAIDQLGATGPDKLSIRLGGIYALKRIMRDSLADEPTVIEILCAFIRTNTPRKKFPPVEPAAVPSAPEDVRAAVAVLGWRPKPDFEQNSRLDLSGSQLSLSNIWLIDAHLSNVQLVGA